MVLDGRTPPARIVVSLPLSSRTIRKPDGSSPQVTPSSLHTCFHPHALSDSVAGSRVNIRRISSGAKPCIAIHAPPARPEVFARGRTPSSAARSPAIPDLGKHGLIDVDPDPRDDHSPRGAPECPRTSCRSSRTSLGQRRSAPPPIASCAASPNASITTGTGFARNTMDTYKPAPGSEIHVWPWRPMPADCPSAPTISRAPSRRAQIMVESALEPIDAPRQSGADGIQVKGGIEFRKLASYSTCDGGIPR